MEPVPLAGYSIFLGNRERNQGGAIAASDLIRGDVDFNCNGKKRGSSVGIVRKRTNQEHLISVNCINYGLEDLRVGDKRCYIYGNRGHPCSSRSFSNQSSLHTVSSHSSSGSVLNTMADGGEMKERSVEAAMEGMVSAGGVLTAAEELRSQSAMIGAGVSLIQPSPDRLGKMVSRRSRGNCTPLVIDMEAARKAVSGFLVVGRLLSPFKVNPRVIVDDLRNTAWKNQGVVTIQEVASDDGRFILNLAAESDRRFVLKAQPWHFKRDGLIFAEFDGKGDPAEVDLGVMTIWVQEGSPLRELLSRRQSYVYRHRRQQHRQTRRHRQGGHCRGWSHGL
uniref:Uncharacterized protein n=1 Tax=Aegilops tauschii subsp. strangulata TaxID=200361 RepID=A0A453EXE0_AEGTS